MRRNAGGWVLALVLALPGLAAAATADGPHKIKRLGGSTSFHKPPLKVYDDLRNMLKKRLPDVKVILDEAGWKGNIEDLMNAAVSGDIKDIKIEPGAEIPWMSLKRGKKPTILRKPQGMVWGGKKAFEAYVLEFDSNGTHWTMTVPKPCGNFWITGREVPPPPAPTIDVKTTDVCISQPVQASLTIGNALPNDQVHLSVDGREIETFAAANGSTSRTLNGLAVGAHEVKASIERGGAKAQATANVKACPPVCSLQVSPAEIRRGKTINVNASGSHVAAGVTGTISGVSVEITRDGAVVETVALAAPGLTKDVVLAKKGNYSFKAVATDSLGQKSDGGCTATAVAVNPPIVPFGAAYFGKERMVRDEFEGGRCAPLVGAKVGLLRELGDGGGELELALGGKLNTRDSDNSSIFADLAINRVTRRAFFGGGISFWDITLDDTRSLAALVHGGFDLDSQGRFGLTVEGRVPFDGFDDISNNYMFWGGFRIRPGK